MIFFLSQSKSGPEALRIAKPSSLYSPILFLPTSLASWCKRNRPTITQTSASSKDPIVTSKSKPLFLIQAMFLLNWRDFLQCLITALVSSSITTHCLAKQIESSSIVSRLWKDRSRRYQM